jgi:hypothetical protein
MRGNEWETGTVVLPSSDFSKVRQAVERAEKDHQHRVFGLTQECWFGMSRHEQDRADEYDAAVADFIFLKTSSNRRTGSLVGHSHLGLHTMSADPWLDEAIREAKRLLARRPDQFKPARVQKGDIEFPTNRTTHFIACEAEIVFEDRRTVTWSVISRNFPLEVSASHPASMALRDELSNVRWSPGTGGGIEGNDGVVAAYGPIGADVAPHRCLPFATSRGKKVTQADLDRMIVRQARRAA